VALWPDPEAGRATQKKKMNKTMQDLLLKENKGVTLIELMIALVISAVLVGGTYSIFISQQRTFILQDQVVGAQQDGRAALIIMAKDLRMAGMLTGVDGFSVYGATEAITPTNSSTAPDQVRVVYAAEEFTSGGTSATVTNVAGSQVTLSASIGAFFNSSTKQYVAFEGVTHVYQVSSVAGNILTLSESPSANLATFNARVLRVRAITYNVSGNALQRNDGEGAQTLAGATNQSQVEDLQIAYQVDGDTTNWYNTTPVGKTNADIRTVRINLVVRTPLEDTKDQNYTRPALEDHAGSATNDGFRRRAYTTVVKLRNF
jgi:prepilin-type N-terminal cleavage/methylation domain-containing protein